MSGDFSRSPSSPSTERNNANGDTMNSKQHHAEVGVRRPPALRMLSRQRSCSSFEVGAKKIDHVLTPEEKRFILLVERGDTASVRKTILAYKDKPYVFDINCVDPLGRSGLSIAIINENPEMMDMLLSEGIMVKVCTLSL